MKQFLTYKAKEQTEDSRSSHHSDVIFSATHLKQVHLYVCSLKENILPGSPLRARTALMVKQHLIEHLWVRNAPRRMQSEWA